MPSGMPSEHANRWLYFSHVKKPEFLTQEMLDAAKALTSTRHWVAAWNMATDQYDHPLEINPTTGKGFQSLFLTMREAMQ